jgi:hypothetical protein
MLKKILLLLSFIYFCCTKFYFLEVKIVPKRFELLLTFLVTNLCTSFLRFKLKHCFFFFSHIRCICTREALIEEHRSRLALNAAARERHGGRTAARDGVAAADSGDPPNGG